MHFLKVRNIGKIDSDISTFLQTFCGKTFTTCSQFQKHFICANYLEKKANFKHQFYSIFLTSPHLSADGVALLGLP